MNLRGRWYRFTARLGHRFGIHKWACYQDCGDGVHVNPNVAMRHADWCVCTWCGERRTR